MKTLTSKQCYDTEQGSIDWHIARLGKITSSHMGELMRNGKSKNTPFTVKAQDYFKELAMQRMLLEDITMEQFLDRYQIKNRAMQFGNDTEELARSTFEKTSEVFCTVPGFVDAGYIEGVEKIEGYGDSPDGCFVDKDNTMCCLEIKCPNGSTFLDYLLAFKNGKSLKDVNFDYYWQCVSHMYCNNAKKCYFLIFDPFITCGYHVEVIERDEEEINEMLKRIYAGLEYIKTIMYIAS